jgi:hypothetical protein
VNAAPEGRADISVPSDVPTAATVARTLARRLPLPSRLPRQDDRRAFGGRAMTDPALKENFARDVARLLRLVGMMRSSWHGRQAGASTSCSRRWGCRPRRRAACA